MNNDFKILTYAELKPVKVIENNEEMVRLNNLSDHIVCRYEKQDMVPFLGEDIFVRKTVADKLREAAGAVQVLRDHLGHPAGARLARRG